MATTPTAPTSTRCIRGCVLVVQHVWVCCTCPADAPPLWPRSHPCVPRHTHHVVLQCSPSNGECEQTCLDNSPASEADYSSGPTNGEQQVPSACNGLQCVVSALQHHSVMATLCHPARHLTLALSSAGYTCMCNKDTTKPDLAANGKNCTGTLTVLGVITMRFVTGCVWHHWALLSLTEHCSQPTGHCC